MEGMPEVKWKEKEFRADPESDAVQALLGKMGLEDAKEELRQRLIDNPEDAESKRQLTLLESRGEELSTAEGGETMQ